MYTQLIIDIFTNINNNLYKISLEQAHNIYLNNSYASIHTVYGMSINNKNYNFGDVFFNEETKEILVASSIITSKEDINYLVAFGFIRFKGFDDFLHLSELNKNQFRYNLKRSILNNGKEKDVKFIPIEEYINKHEIVYKGNICLSDWFDNNEIYNNFYHDNDIKNSDYTIIRNLFFVLNTSITLKHQAHNLKDKELCSFSDILYLKLKNLEIKPYLSLSLFIKHDTQGYVVEDIYLDKQDVIKINKNKSINSDVIMYVLNKDGKASVLLPFDKNEIYTSTGQILNKNKLNTFMLFESNKEDKFISVDDKKYDDYFLQFI